MSHIFTYKHDNGPTDAMLEIVRLGYKDGFYRVEILCTDATDTERLINNVLSAYDGNPTFKAVTV